MSLKPRLAIVISHPIQYFAPLYRRLASHDELAIKVFFTWHCADQPVYDSEFRREVKWDIPVTEGYPFELVPNTSRDPGTHHFFGLRNPSLVARVQAWNPDAVLVSGWAWHSHLLALRAFAKLRIPVFFRGDSHLLRRRGGLHWWIKKAILRRVFAWPHTFLAIGTANRNYYHAFGVSSERIVDCPFSVEVSRFAEPAGQLEHEAEEWRRQLEIPPDHLVLLFAGKLEPRKCPVELMKAVRDLSETKVTLVIAGSGQLDDEVRNFAAAIPQRFRLLPFQNQSRMPVLYRLGDLFVLPSSEEPWGLAVNEALASARPVLVSDRAGCAADVVTPECGFIFPGGSQLTLLQALESVAGNRAKLLEMRIAASRRARQFDIPVTAAAILKALDRIRENKQSCAPARS